MISRSKQGKQGPSITHQTETKHYTGRTGLDETEQIALDNPLGHVERDEDAHERDDAQDEDAADAEVKTIAHSLEKSLL